MEYLVHWTCVYDDACGVHESACGDLGGVVVFMAVTVTVTASTAAVW